MTNLNQNIFKLLPKPTALGYSENPIKFSEWNFIEYGKNVGITRNLINLKQNCQKIKKSPVLH